MAKFLNKPETHIAIFGFMTSFVWEMLQMPFFEMGDMGYYRKTLGCTVASFADAGIMVIAYSAVSIYRKSRDWMYKTNLPSMAIYLLTGLIITVIAEKLATAMPYGNGWQYSNLMPVIPWIGIGLVPVLMWIIIPLLTLWFARRQPRRDGGQASDDKRQGIRYDRHSK